MSSLAQEASTGVAEAERRCTDLASLADDLNRRVQGYRLDDAELNQHPELRPRRVSEMPAWHQAQGPEASRNELARAAGAR
jgi:hypothetical protein